MSAITAPPGYIDPRKRPRRFAGVLLNIAVVLFLLSWTFSFLSVVGTSTVILGLGLIGIWRHSWGAINIIRAVIFQRRAASRSEFLVSRSSGLVVIATVYNQTDEEVAAIVSALANSVKHLPFRPLVIFAYLTSNQRKIMEAAASSRMSVHYVLQRGLGKREALADSLWLAKSIVPAGLISKYAVLLMDGDTMVTPEAIKESIITLEHRAEIGAVVVNERPLLKSTTIFGVWRLLRSLQRNKLMSSFALSDRTLVLTGRFAMLRAEIMLQPEVISRMRKDYLRTKNLHIPLLTGDDKTTWLETLRRGYGMVYLPNIFIYPIERQNPGESFYKSVTNLMGRYSGNMARANLHSDAWRNIKGKRHFAYGLIDQRISMWTSLLTPVVLILFLISGNIASFVIFLTYVAIIKNIQALAVSALGGHYDPWFPFLIFFDQIFQSIIKVRAFAYLHRQSWNNQGIKLASGPIGESSDAAAQRLFILRLLFFGIFIAYAYFFLRDT